MKNFDYGRDDYNEALGGNGGEDAEPVFLLRGQDPAAAHAVRQWARMAGDYGVSPEVRAQANEHARRMDAYAARSDHGPATVPGT